MDMAHKGNVRSFGVLAFVPLALMKIQFLYQFYWILNVPQIDFKSCIRPLVGILIVQILCESSFGCQAFNL